VAGLYSARSGTIPPLPWSNSLHRRSQFTYAPFRLHTPTAEYYVVRQVSWFTGLGHPPVFRTLRVSDIMGAARRLQLPDSSGF